MADLPDITLDDAADALAFVDPEIRDTWLKMGMAVKAEFGEDGFDTWDSWSQQGSSYKPSAARDVWKSFKRGGVGIGTLLKMARDAGYVPKQRSEAEQQKLAEISAKRRAKVKAQQEKQQAEYEKKVAECAERAKSIWEKLPDSGKGPYLFKKQVGSYGLKFSRDSVVVPVRNVQGDLKGLQFIDADGNKKFLTGTPKSGCFHFIGEVTAGCRIGVAEGYATAATIHKITKIPIAVAFDAGNLLSVASALRGVYPDNEFVIFGDDDRKTEGNPGRTKAEAAAKAVNGRAVFPFVEASA